MTELPDRVALAKRATTASTSVALSLRQMAAPYGRANGLDAAATGVNSDTFSISATAGAAAVAASRRTAPAQLSTTALAGIKHQAYCRTVCQWPK